MIRTLIVDDEQPAQQRLEQLLAKESDIELVRICSDGQEAIAAIGSQKPDLVFLDVQMPELSGIDVVRSVGLQHMPVVVFVTAFDRYALEAFELAALDYLLKPFDNERFTEALQRAREQIRLRAVGQVHTKLKRLLEEVEHIAPATQRRPGHPGYLQRLAIEDRGQVRVIPVTSIDYITSSGPYVELHIGNRPYLIRKRIKELANELDPAQFCRIHRSTIVNLLQIDALEPQAYGDYAVKLKDGTNLRVSRSHRDQLALQLGISLN